MLALKPRKFLAGIAIGAALFVPGQAAFAQDDAPAPTPCDIFTGKFDCGDKAPAPRPEPTCDPRLASCDLTSQPEEPECNPILASCDLTSQPEEPECNPILASCDVTSQPDDPGDPEDEVDEPVDADPTFTG